MIWLLGATLHVSAILVVALVMLWLLRKRSASLRHLVIVIAMACAAMAPMLAAYLPAWPGIHLPDFIENPTPIHVSLEEYARPEVATATVLRELQPMESESGMPASIQVHSPSWRDAPQSVSHTAFMMYIAGVVVCLLRLIAGLFRLRWIAAQARPLRSNRWQRRATAIAVAYRLRRSVLLMRSPRPVLATWGVARPQVLLPAGAEDWPDDRVRAVLLHELAHVRRNDWLIQVMAGLLRSVYWFNPLVWLAFARLRQESEQACDDAALRQGEDNVQYAEQLLALARSLNGQAASVLSAAPAMALRSTLKRRIALVLDPATPRAPPSRTTLVALSAILLIATCAIAACNGKRTMTAENEGTPSTVMQASAAAPVTQSIAETLDPQPMQAESAAAVVATPETAVPDAPTADNSADFRTAVPDRGRYAEPRSPANIIAGILDLVESALADESLAVLDEVQRPITGLHHVQRFARTVLEEDGRDPAIQAANYVEIINALKNTALFASNVTSTPRGAMLSKQKIDQLAAAMREQAAALADAMLPTPRITSIVVSTPERRAAISALDLAQTSLRNLALSARTSNNWLVNELDTLERAAQSVLSDDGSSQSDFTIKLYALRGALVSTSRNANNILQRPRASPDVSNSARELSTSIRRVLSQLDGAQSEITLHGQLDSRRQ